ncbi:right-handed parallel beta-helix repeat-containing protein [bacterium]|nr:right-handed parallel beta-helix repeat-containing protein [candidate division CSSED10-310 bacterium]
MGVHSHHSRGSRVLSPTRIAVVAVIILTGLGGLIVADAATIRVPENYATIQDGIDAAVNGDCVLVTGEEFAGPGNQNMTFRGKAITVRSATRTRINCKATPEEPCVGFIFQDGEMSDACLSGFDIMHAGYGEWPLAAGICIVNQSSPTICDCSVDTSEYGMIVEATSNPSVNGCRITHCEMDGLLWSFHSRGTLINCLIVGNGRHGMAAIHLGNPDVVNCTLADNSGYGVMLDESETVFRSCIVWNNHDGGIDDTISFPDVAYCLIQGGYGGTGNLDMDPLFITGSCGDFYLSHTGAGQANTSPCVDAGHAGSQAVCFDSGDGMICLDGMTTRVDGFVDTETVDMGYHVATDEVVPTPTPVVSPTPTPAMSPSPSGTPTPDNPDGVSVDITVPDSPVHSGDTFFLTVNIGSAHAEPLMGIPLFCFLELGGAFWFYPDWTIAPAWIAVDVPPAGTIPIVIIPPFTWPATAGDGACRIWSALCDSEMTRILGFHDMEPFSWN